MGIREHIYKKTETSPIRKRLGSFCFFSIDLYLTTCFKIPIFSSPNTDKLVYDSHCFKITLLSHI